MHDGSLTTVTTQEVQEILGQLRVSAWEVQPHSAERNGMIWLNLPVLMHGPLAPDDPYRELLHTRRACVAASVASELLHRIGMITDREIGASRGSDGQINALGFDVLTSFGDPTVPLAEEIAKITADPVLFAEAVKAISKRFDVMISDDNIDIEAVRDIENAIPEEPRRGRQDHSRITQTSDEERSR